MLNLLKIKNIAVASKVELELGPGLNLLTGETGAGKSILIDALGLLLGTRASAELVRTGESQAVVEGVFTAEHRPGLEARGAVSEDGEVIIRREISTSGKGRATLNGAVVPVSILRELAPELAVIHGQHEPQGLLDPTTHLARLDHHASLAADVAAVSEPFRRMREAEEVVDRLRRDRDTLEERRDALRFRRDEIEKASIEPGEDERLKQEKQLHVHAEKLSLLAEEAYAILYDDESAVLPRLGQAFRRIDDLARIDARFAPHAEARPALQAQLQDIALALRDYRDGLPSSPGRLDEIETRLAQLERLKRKYGPTLDEVIATGEKARTELAETGDPREREEAAALERERATADYERKAGALSVKRKGAARDLKSRVEAVLGELAMPRSRFDVRFAAGAVPTAAGVDDVEFLFSTNVGEDLRPLARIASGGELSRILLALESVANLAAAGRTLVFDEVDAGIGGGVAEVVGRKLKAMAARDQVLCVSHLPQIAAQADHHFRVVKRQSGGRTVVEVEALGPKERVEEVARMLAGETVTEAARQHARELIEHGGRRARA
jgi:DNA repair protein RecN (Recombination protein N)